MATRKEARPPPVDDTPDPDLIREPIKVAEFWKNRRGETIRVTLTSYEGRNVLDVRTYVTAKDGTMQPTRKGLTLLLGKLPDLAAALIKAEAEARKLGLLEARGGRQ